MRWRDYRQSENVEDRRGMRIGRGAPIGCGGLIVVLLVSWLLGADPTQLLMLFQGDDVGTHSTDVQAPTGEPDDQLGKFASVVLADTEETWRAVFSSRGKSYQEPQLVMFNEAVDSACGISSAAVGPFYCPLDGKVYLDLSFFSDLSERFGAPGDFAAAYVIAHEVGHHVQNLLGIADQVHGLQDRSSRGAANELSVRFELQADCLAGVWAHDANARGLLEAGEVREALEAARAVGDDRIQRQAGVAVNPETWTHGSAEQREQWFRAGFDTGDTGACNTFA
jgi:hypothetical protein